MTATAPHHDCWNQIGVFGDKSCKGLAEHSHCRSCPEFAKAGLGLFDREPPQGYAEKWTRLLAEEKAARAVGLLSAVVFGLGRESMAVRTACFHSVRARRPIHTVPHRTAGHVLGLVNVQGEIVPCVSLAGVVGVDGTESRETVRGRLLVLKDVGGLWVLPVDKVVGVVRFDPKGLTPPPVTVAKSPATFTRGMFVLDGADVALLDEQLLFAALSRSLNP